MLFIHVVMNEENEDESRELRTVVRRLCTGSGKNILSKNNGDVVYNHSLIFGAGAGVTMRSISQGT